MSLTVTLPIRTVSEANGTHGHWRTKWRRTKNQICLVKLYLAGKPLPPLPITCKLTRLSAGSLDGHDNLRVSMKHIVDAIAELYGKPDKEKCFRWKYAQQKCKAKAFGVVIEIEERKGKTK